MGLEGCWGGPEVAAEPAGGVPGLFLGRGFLGAEEQAQLVARAGELCSAPGRTGGASPGAPNQAMRFAGSTGLPPWADDLAELVSEFLLHGGVVTRGAPLRFNQMIVNRYSPGQGISAHVDLAVFGDVVASVSLESAAMMDFSPKGGGEGKVSVRLEPGDLLVLSGQARWDWLHGISACPYQRTSISLRTLGKGGPHVLTEHG